MALCVRTLSVLATTIGLLVPPVSAIAGNPVPYADTQIISTNQTFEDLWSNLESAVKANRMGIVGRASASMGDKSQGFEIPGNTVLMMFRNDFARRMLAASVPAGIEAPLRFHVTENADGTATLTYRLPSSVSGPTRVRN